MTPDEKVLWQKISLFKFDDEDASFKFSQRLAKENGWDRSYTNRVIEEYRKFIFLCCVADTGITPSDPVDQAWHLHLTFTRSYWIDLCKDTIGKELHHNPTKGGRAEAKKFNSYYGASNKLYQAKFATEPPADIWHDSRTRFTDIKFQRVNMSKYWLIRRPAFKWPHGIFQLNLLALVVFMFATTEVLIGVAIFILLVAYLAYATSYNDSNEKKEKYDNGGCGGATASGEHGYDHDVDSSSETAGHHAGGHHSDSDSSNHGCSSADSGCSSGCGGGCGGD